MNDAEKKYLFYSSGLEHTSSFYKLLFDTIHEADSENLEKLRAGFPDEVKVVERVRNEPNYFKKLEKEFYGLDR